MSFTFENLFNELETRMHPGLISANAFASIKTVGRLLANGITYGLGFETRPAEALAEVDLILRPMAPQGLDIIAGQAAGSQFPDTLAEAPHWGTLQALCRNWANPGSVLRETVACLWIEIDAEHCREPTPKPSLVFVQLHRSRYHPELCLSVAQELHASLKGYPLSSTIIRSLGHCLERMPKKGLVTLLGLALARPSEALRLVVGELEPDEIPEYVASLGWKGRINELESLIFSLAGYADRHSINFDLDSQGIGKIGIEFGIPQEHSFVSDPRWKILLDFLVQQGWCRKEKRDGLLAWPNPFVLRSVGSESVQVRRFISHIKLSLETGRKVVAKAYFGLVW